MSRRGGANVDSVFAAAEATYRRDSTTIDSLARLVDTDSLYGLYREALDPSKATVSLVERAYCSQFHLEIRYGKIPARWATKRMRDTVYRDHGITDGFRYFASLVPAEGSVSSRCLPLPPRGPVVVNGTRTDVEPLNPRG